MTRGGSVVLAAVMLLVGAACSDDGDNQEAFDLTGRVVAVEPAAQPANDPTDSNVTGAIVLQVDAPGGCQADANGVRVYVDDETTFTPTSASGDLQSLEGETVNASGSLTKDGDTCTPIAVSVNAQSAIASPGAGDESGDAGADGGPGATGSPGATSSPNDPDDEGSITDTEETASARPNDPDDEGVVPQP